MKLIHELNEDDFDRRVEICEYMMNMIEANPQLPKNIVFSDEASFELNGNVNRHNFRYWSDENPHWSRDSHTQYPQKLNLWAGILNDRVIGPFVIEGTLTAAKYLRMLQEQIVPAIRRIAGDNFNNIFFQQDGAPPHYALEVREYLDEVFPDRWIGRRGTIEWPARSPDLSPLDYFFWGYIKERIYKIKPNNLDDLRQRIFQEIDSISEETFENVINSFYNRLAYCLESQGEQFEQRL